MKHAFPHAFRNLPPTLRVTSHGAAPRCASRRASAMVRRRSLANIPTEPSTPGARVDDGAARVLDVAAGTQPVTNFGAMWHF
jgi:hypothetical protein